MRIVRSLAAIVLLQSLTPLSHAAWSDQHSVEAIAGALASPIPNSALEQARRLDDQILQTGKWEGVKVYLVTDERSRHAQQLVNKLLGSIGETPSGWVVRVLDTEPHITNAFVAGGKYVYIFTGLINEAKSDDELAFVVGHELGHTLLKHNLRRQNDLNATLVNLAVIVAATSNGSTQAGAMALAKTLHNSYSVIDEREADTFGVLISSRAGFDPMRGIDFFSRQERAADTAIKQLNSRVQEYSVRATNANVECQTLTQKWNNLGMFPSQKNADIVNQSCANARQQTQLYNEAVAQALQADSNRRLAQISSDHPDSQERIASIAALTDFVAGVRPIDSLTAHVQSQRVVSALAQQRSILLQPRQRVEDKAASVATTPTMPEPTISSRLQALKELREAGLIEQAEYERKKQDLLRQL